MKENLMKTSIKLVMLVVSEINSVLLKGVANRFLSLITNTDFSLGRWTFTAHAYVSQGCISMKMTISKSPKRLLISPVHTSPSPSNRKCPERKQDQTGSPRTD